MRKNQTFVAVAVALLLLGGELQSQDTDGNGLVSYLVPVAMPPGESILGAYGSDWRMELWIHNGSEMGMGHPQPGPECPVQDCGDAVPPGARGEWWAAIHHRYAAVFYIPAEIAPRFWFSARLLERSRQAQPRGVEIPVVPEDEFFTAPSSFLGVPLDSSGRSTLRVYDPDARPGASVLVKFWSINNRLLATHTLTPGNDTPSRFTPSSLPYGPAQDAIFDLRVSVPELIGHERCHITIEPITPGLRYWGLVSVTDNATQHVLMITAR